jgi:hypothetical protein
MSEWSADNTSCTYGRAQRQALAGGRCVAKRRYDAWPAAGSLFEGRRTKQLTNKSLAPRHPSPITASRTDGGGRPCSLAPDCGGSCVDGSLCLCGSMRFSRATAPLVLSKFKRRSLGALPPPRTPPRQKTRMSSQPSQPRALDCRHITRLAATVTRGQATYARARFPRAYSADSARFERPRRAIQGRRVRGLNAQMGEQRKA